MINYELFEKKTIDALLNQLNYSASLLDNFDPNYEDIEGRKQASELIRDLREAIKGE